MTMKTHYWQLGVGVGGLILCLASIVLIPAPSKPGWETLGGVSVWTDPKTGCRYTEGNDGMKPLVGPDGLPDCARRQ